MRPRLIEDEAGAPLPHELQRDGAIWQVIRDHLGGLRTDGDDDYAEDLARDDEAEQIMRALAPVLWPLLPSNDKSWSSPVDPGPQPGSSAALREGRAAQ